MIDDRGKVGGGPQASLTNIGIENVNPPSVDRITHARRRSNPPRSPLLGGTLRAVSTNAASKVPSASTAGPSAKLLKLFGTICTGSSKVKPPVRERATWTLRLALPSSPRIGWCEVM